MGSNSTGRKGLSISVRRACITFQWFSLEFPVERILTAFVVGLA